MRTKELSIPEQHQLKIAKSTLKMSDVGARIMGGMSKDEARAFLTKIGWSAARIAKLEQPEQPKPQQREQPAQPVVCCCPSVACPVHGLPPGSACGGW